MKKYFFSLALILAMGLTASAQESLFKYGPDSDEYRTESDGGPSLILPGSHGMTEDAGATPLGMGTTILLGMGAAYLISKKRRKE